MMSGVGHSQILVPRKSPSLNLRSRQKRVHEYHACPFEACRPTQKPPPTPSKTHGALGTIAEYSVVLVHAPETVPAKDGLRRILGKGREYHLFPLGTPRIRLGHRLTVVQGLLGADPLSGAEQRSDRLALAARWCVFIPSVLILVAGVLNLELCNWDLNLERIARVALTAR